MTIDLLPTIARIDRGEADRLGDGGKLDGKDISPLLFAEPGAKSPHEAYFFYWNNELHGRPLRARGSSTFRTPTDSGGQQGRQRRQTWAVQRGQGRPGALQPRSDLSERTDVAAANPAVVQRLQALADRMRDDLGDSLRKKKGK